jgi:hypothetical protein
MNIGVDGAAVNDVTSRLVHFIVTTTFAWNTYFIINQPSA